MAQRHMDRLTSFDTSFLANEKSNGHMAIGAVLVCDGAPPSYEEFLASIRSRLHLLPRLRQRLAYPASGPRSPLLGRPPAVRHPRARAPHEAAGAGRRRAVPRRGRRDLRSAARPRQSALGVLPGRGDRGRPLRDRLQDPPRDGRRDLGGRHRRPALRRRAEHRAGPRGRTLGAAALALELGPRRAGRHRLQPNPRPGCALAGCRVPSPAAGDPACLRRDRRPLGGDLGADQAGAEGAAQRRPLAAPLLLRDPLRPGRVQTDQERPRRHRQRRHPGGHGGRPAQLDARAQPGDRRASSCRPWSRSRSAPKTSTASWATS